LPGIDGTGWAASSQFGTLHELFELHALRIPPGNRASLSSLAETVVAQT
jgi:hypothetical protein